MRIERFDWDGQDPASLAAKIRALQPPVGEVGEPVRGIISAIRDDGDEALTEIEARFGDGPVDPDALRQPEDAIRSAASRLDPELLTAMETAAANIRAVAEAQLAGDQELKLEQGQSVGLREVPVGSAGIYAPGGAAAYPSTVLMGCIPAKVAGVGRVVLATPPGGTEQRVPDVVLAAAAIAGADEVYAMGGAQAIAALALGTEQIAPVDVIAGPGNRYVQEAKRQLTGEVGIDGIAGPSELMVIAGDTSKPEWMALDLCAQAEHGPESPLVVAAVEEHVLEAVATAAELAAASRPSVADAPLGLVQVDEVEAAIELANAYAPEHLELLETDAALMADRVTTAGCVFAGRHGATAFGDYVAGSNHVLPTGGAGRYAGPLGPGAFRRRISKVELSEAAAAELAPHVDVLARAEGFPVHAESAMIRR
jgi:histidinol dehydrogenase